MKDSLDQQWLSDLPSHWEEKRADFLCDPYRITIDPSGFEDAFVAHYLIPQVQENGRPRIEPASDISSLKLLVDEPMILVSKLNPRKTTVCIAEPHPEYPTLASSEFVSLKSNMFDQKYGYYFWCSSKVTDRLSALVQSATRSHQRVNPNDIKKLPWKWPPPATQRRIAAYLDEKTARIDGLIGKKRELLERLAEKRQALITRAVTKGLNPDAPMKPSGIDWLSDIPKHWDLVPLRWYLRTASGEGLQNQQISIDKAGDMLVPVIGGNGCMGYTNLSNSLSTPIVVGRVGAHCGNVHYISEPSWITDNALKVFRIRGFDYLYLLHALRIRNLNTLAARNAQPLMTGEVVKSQVLAKPPSNEQNNITASIGKFLERFHKNVEKIKNSIDLLTEYRSALITAAVTGQIAELQ